ncbi:hypothetical protein [Aliiglaciecola sp. LCG003]|uniref:hypothetical protein n=1 Tax=Aliiglaciecola sp. LCG003 TaxID=3053655 RepID=UPI0025748511|nr:hypothetical protein [Aliiglaciecola sp. LCG003]WJG09972.1 hypothetical protein QR722_02745 [Aliiglaciecola sp. LCG003]
MLKRLILATFACLTVACGSDINPAPKQTVMLASEPAQANVPANDDNCVAEASWFPHSQTPFPDGNTFNGKTNCAFHRWSWQMFLWLTQPVDGKPRFLKMQSPYDMLGIEDRESMLPRLTKSAHPRSMDEYLQAGTEGILIDQNGKAVYYSQYVNDEFVNFIEGKHPDNKINLTIPLNVQQFPADKSFPVNAIELKASWKILAPDEDTRNLYTMESSVFKLANKNGKIVVDDKSSMKVLLGLVGFHIAGVVKGHPEMIWATFEHQGNAPDVPADYDFSNPTTAVSKDNFTFYKANTPYSGCNINPANSPVLKLDQDKQTLTPVTQMCRRYALGNDANQTTMSVPTNIKVVTDLNKSVASQFKDAGVWSKYAEVGAIWFKGPNRLKPGMAIATDFEGDQQLLIGSLRLSNASIETFTQTQSTMYNCFRCHNTSQRFPDDTKLAPLKPMNLNISHAFMNIYFWSQTLQLQASAASTH